MCSMVYDKSTMLKDIKMSTLTLHAFGRAGLNTVGDILDMDIEDIYNIRNIGELSVTRLRDELLLHGVEWDITRKVFDRTMTRKLALDTSITDVGADPRVINALYITGIQTVADLVTKSYDELIVVRGIGDKSLRRLKDIILKHNITWNIVIP
jgi:DNA-directed RNA polymerase alpha subunit